MLDTQHGARARYSDQESVTHKLVRFGAPPSPATDTTALLTRVDGEDTHKVWDTFAQQSATKVDMVDTHTNPV